MRSRDYQRLPNEIQTDSDNSGAPYGAISGGRLWSSSFSSSSTTTVSSSSSSSSSNSSSSSSSGSSSGDSVDPLAAIQTSRSAHYFISGQPIAATEDLPPQLQRTGSFIVKNGSEVFEPRDVLGEGAFGRVRRFEKTFEKGPTSTWQAATSSDIQSLAVKNPKGDPRNFNSTLVNEQIWSQRAYPNSFFEIHHVSSNRNNLNTRVIMDYVPGGTLQNVLQNGNLFPMRALSLFLAVGMKLFQNHQASVVHADFKEDNVMVRDVPLDRDYTADDITIIDGGLSGMVGEYRNASLARARIRSPHYPPEKYSTNPGDKFRMSPSLDVYSFSYCVSKHLPPGASRNLISYFKMGMEPGFLQRATMQQLLAALRVEILSRKILCAIQAANIIGDSTVNTGTSRRCIYDLSHQILQLMLNSLVNNEEWEQQVGTILSEYIFGKLSDKPKNSKLVTQLLNYQVIQAQNHAIYEMPVGCLCCASVGFARRNMAQAV